MANKITAYHVNDNNGEKERNNNTWMNEPNNNDSKVLNFHENETMATEGKNNTKYYSDIDMSKGAKTYETRAIKRFYIYTGILPDCIEFTNVGSTALTRSIVIRAADPNCIDHIIT